VLLHRNGKRTQNPLFLYYGRNPPVVFALSPLAQLRRWSVLRPSSPTFFALEEDEDLSVLSATHAVTTPLSALTICAPAGCVQKSHSTRIGAYNEWLALSFPTPWIMHRMGCESAGMLRLCYDPCITVTDDSGWFFVLMRPRI
jgi:hypothetical protein